MLGEGPNDVVISACSVVADLVSAKLIGTQFRV